MTIEELRVIITAKTESLQDGVKKVKDKIKDLKGSTDDMASSNQKNINKIRTQYNQLIKDLDIINAKAEMQQRKLNSLREKYSRYEGIRADTPKAIRLQEQIVNTEARLQKLINTSDNTVAKISELEDKLSASGSTAGNLNDKFNSIKNRLDEIKDRFRKTGDEARNSTGKIAGFANMINKSFMRVARRIFIYNLMYKAIRGLINYMGGALSTNQAFSNSLAQVKTNLQVAFMPIYQVILPAINALMSALARATAYIASFVSTIFGKTYQQSFKAVQGLNKAKVAMAGVGKQAKKTAKDMKGSLAGFDEVNIISTKENSDSEGGGGVDVPALTAPDFDTAPTEGKIKEFVDRLKILLEPAREALNGLKEAFEPLKQNLFDGLKWLLDNVLIPIGSWTISEVLPRFIEILSNVLLILNEVIEALKPLAQWLWEEFLQPLGQWAGEKILQALDWLNEKLVAISEWIRENQSTVQTLAIIVGGFAAAWALVNTAIGIWTVVAGIATGITAAFGAVMAFITSPITLVVAAIGAVIAIGVLLYKNWDKVKEFAGKLWEGIKESFNNIRTKVGEVWNNIKEWGLDTWTKITDTFRNVGTWFSEKFTAAWNGITGAFSSVKTWASEKWNDVKDVFKSVPEWFRTKFHEAWTKVKNVFSTGGEIFTGIKDGIADTFKTIVNGLIGGINRIIRAPFNAINGMLNKIRNISVLGLKPFSGLWGHNPLSVPQIPKLAKGAVIPPNSEFLAVLGDQKSGTNIETPERLLRQIMQEELRSRSSDFGNAEIHLTVKIGEDTITEKVISNINRQSRVSGKTVITV